MSKAMVAAARPQTDASLDPCCSRDSAPAAVAAATGSRRGGANEEGQ